MRAIFQVGRPSYLIRSTSVAQNCFNCWEKLARYICFQDILSSVSVHGCAPYIGIVLLSQKHNLGLRGDLLDVCGSFEAVQDRHSDIKEY